MVFKSARQAIEEKIIETLHRQRLDRDVVETYWSLAQIGPSTWGLELEAMIEGDDHGVRAGITWEGFTVTALQELEGGLTKLLVHLDVELEARRRIVQERNTPLFGEQATIGSEAGQPRLPDHYGQPPQAPAIPTTGRRQPPRF